MAEILNFVKENPSLYTPKSAPGLVEVPEVCFLAVDGEGAPEGECYQNAVGALYSVAYTLKMLKKQAEQPEGYVEFKVPPLEGFWVTPENQPLAVSRDVWQWTSVLRVPEWVTLPLFETIVETVKRKKPNPALDGIRLWRYEEGLCVQMMHIGPYSAEETTMGTMGAYIETNGLKTDYRNGRRHHEIYLSDPRRTNAERMKTVLRLPVRKA